MTVGDGHSGVGATRYHWDRDVRRNVHKALSRFPQASANTYTCHPYCGWGRRSVDFWDRAGRGHALDAHITELLLDFLFEMPDGPLIRHYILGHTLWTSFGGYSTWAADDHSGVLRHLHVTYWPVPPIR